MERWCRRLGRPVGGLLTMDQAWRLAHAWYVDRLDPAWRRRTVAETEALFRGLGLTGPFWQVRPPA